MESTLHTFRCIARRRGDHWIVACYEYPHTRLIARTLAGAHRAQRAAIADALDMPDDHVAVDLDPVLSPAVARHLARAEQLRREAIRANGAAAHERRAAARALSAEGLSLRDIGTILGVSPQRAHQLVTATADPGLRTAPESSRAGGERP